MENDQKTSIVLQIAKEREVRKETERGRGLRERVGKREADK